MKLWIFLLLFAVSSLIHAEPVADSDPPLEEESTTSIQAEQVPPATADSDPVPQPRQETKNKAPDGEEPDPTAVQSATPEQVEQFLAESFNPARNYALPWLRDHVRQGRILLKAFPPRASEIEAALAPFVTELDRHRKGHIKFEGQWYTPNEWAAFEEARGHKLWEAFFKDGPTYTLSGTIVPPDTAMIILGIGLASILILIFLIGQSILSLRHHFSWMPLFGIALPLAVLGLYGWTAIKALQAPPEYTALPEPASMMDQNNSVRQLIYHSLRDPHDGGPPSPRSILLTPEDADAFIARHVSIDPPEDSSFFRFTRQRLRVTSDDRDWIIYDVGTWLGQPMVFTYRVGFFGASYQVSGFLGCATIPARAVESAWFALDAFSRKISSEARIQDAYTPTQMDVRGIEFRRKANSSTGTF
ncbi:MAG: hypothetical protein OHK005_01710 [Candidatus Methylacidiphilales bacterium]